MSGGRNMGAWRAIALGAAMSILIAACGGGGGGGGSNNSPGSGSGLHFTLDRSSIAFDYVDTSGAPTETVVATATGKLPNTLYVGVQDLGGHIDPEVRATLTASTGTFEIRPRNTLAPGNYSGTLNLLACSDQACSHQLGNSPLPVSYTIHVRPGLKVGPQSSTPVVLTSGEEKAVSFTVQLPENATSFTVAPINGGGVCRIDNVTTTGFQVVAYSVRPGDRICQWSVTAGSRFDAGTVFFQILPPAGGEHELSVQEESVTLTAVEGAPSTPVSLHVTPPTWDPNYDIEVVNSSSGFAGAIHFTRSTDGFDVSADAAALAEGSYYASLRVFSLSPFFSSQVTIPIALTVGPGLVRPADVHG